MKNVCFLLLLLSLLLPIAASGQTGSDLILDAGFAKTRAIDPTFFFTARGRWYLNNIVAIEPDIGYWKSDHADRVCNNVQCKDLALRDIDTSVSVIINNPIARRTWLYGGGGIGAHFRKGDVSATQEDTETRFGVQFLFGLQYHFNETTSFDVGARADLVQRGDLEDQHQLKVYAGLMFKL